MSPRAEMKWGQIPFSCAVFLSEPVTTTAIAFIVRNNLKTYMEGGGLSLGEALLQRVSRGIAALHPAGMQGCFYQSFWEMVQGMVSIEESVLIVRLTRVRRAHIA